MKFGRLFELYYDPTSSSVGEKIDLFKFFILWHTKTWKWNVYLSRHFRCEMESLCGADPFHFPLCYPIPFFVHTSKAVPYNYPHRKKSTSSTSRIHLIWPELYPHILDPIQVFPQLSTLSTISQICSIHIQLHPLGFYPSQYPHPFYQGIDIATL